MILPHVTLFPPSFPQDFPAENQEDLRKGAQGEHFGADIHDPKVRTSMTTGGSKTLLSERPGATTIQTSRMALAHFNFRELNHRKNPHAHKNNIGTSTPPFPKSPRPPPKTRNFMGVGVFQQKEPKNARCPQNWRSLFRPQNYGRNNYGHEAFTETSN